MILPRAALQHLSAEFARQHELRAQVDFENAILVFVVMLAGRLGQDGAAVIDQDIDGPLLGLHLLGESVDLFALGQVAGIASKTAPECLDFLGHCAAARLHGGAHPHDIGARLGQR